MGSWRLHHGQPDPRDQPGRVGLLPSYLSQRTQSGAGKEPTGIIGRYASTEENGDGGEESVVTDKAGHFLNFSAGSLR